MNCALISTYQWGQHETMALSAALGSFSSLAYLQLGDSELGLGDFVQFFGFSRYSNPASYGGIWEAPLNWMG